MKAQLICYDCHIRRRVEAPVVYERMEDGKKETYIVGWRCKKCVQKFYVGGVSKSTEGQGWRQRFRILVAQIKKQQAKKKAEGAPRITPEHLQPMADALAESYVPSKEPVKKTLVNKISSFFRRRSM